MSPTASACPTCNASLTAASARFCAYCGTALPQPERSAALAGEERTQARFAALREHPRLARLMRRSPSAASATAGYGCQAAFGVLFTAVAAMIGLTLLGSGFGGGSPKVVLLVPLLFVGVGVFVVAAGARRAQQLATAPTRRLPVRIADERVEVAGGGNDSRARTTYYVTVEDEHGRRTEYAAAADVAAAAAPDDMGIAYVKAFLLLDFQRVRV
jgi:hypothetical protein